MLIPVKPIKDLDGDYIFHKNNIVHNLSRNKISNIYCSGIQILNPFTINKIIKPCEDFNLLWKNLIKKKRLLVSDQMPKKWFTVDNIKQFKRLKKFY
jgi:hypothetical protein